MDVETEIITFKLILYMKDNFLEYFMLQTRLNLDAMILYFYDIMNSQIIKPTDTKFEKAEAYS